MFSKLRGVIQAYDHPLWGIVVFPLLLAVVATFAADKVRVYLLFAAWAFSMLAIRHSTHGRTSKGVPWLPLFVATIVYAALFAAIKIEEFRSTPQITLQVGENTRWNMVQFSTPRAMKATDDIVAEVRPQVWSSTHHLVHADRFVTSVVLNNVGTIPITGAHVAISVLPISRPRESVRLDGLGNDAHRFSNNEISYEVRRVDTYSDSGATLYFSIAISPAMGHVALMVFVNGDNMPGVTSIMELVFD